MEGIQKTKYGVNFAHSNDTPFHVNHHVRNKDSARVKSIQVVLHSSPTMDGVDNEWQPSREQIPDSAPQRLPHNYGAVALWEGITGLRESFKGDCSCQTHLWLSYGGIDHKHPDLSTVEGCWRRYTQNKFLQNDTGHVLILSRRSQLGFRIWYVYM